MFPPPSAQPMEFDFISKGRDSFSRKYEPLILFLTQTVDFSSPGPKEFDYFCFKQYKGDTISTKKKKTSLLIFGFFISFFGYVLRVVNCV